jgi:deoxyribose-phosphate aldolase
LNILKLAEEYERELPPPPAPLDIPRGREIAAWIDHTSLKPEASSAQIKQLCQEAIDNHIYSVCINPANVLLAAALLRGTPVLTCVVVGFPLGATLPTFKVAETMGVVTAGAREVDMVINIGAIKDANYELLYNEIKGVSETAHSQNAKTKVIIEAGLLTRMEKIIACLISKEAGADFVKTSTGMMAGGATVEDVSLMRRVVGAEMGVKAAGGIRSYADACKMIEAGANRLGTSAGMKILEEALKA